MPFETTRLVDWGDCDAAGIVFYPNFYRWMDGHFHQFTEARLGFDQRTWRAYDMLGTPLRHTACTFHYPARFGDTLTVSSAVTGQSDRSFSMAYTFSLSGRLVAEGSEVRVCVAERDGVLKAVPFPEAVSRLITQERGADADAA
ncbi:MAG: thioesterase family protein [Pseudomonadota bacterium]